MADPIAVDTLSISEKTSPEASVESSGNPQKFNMATAPKTPEDKFLLITKGLEETLNPEIIKEILPKRDLKIYWGTATTGRPHIAYFLPAIHIANFLAAGCEMTVLLADIHGFLDNLKAPIEIVQHRAVYYKFCITAILKAVGVPIDKLRFVLGSSYQKSPEYCMDVYRIAALTSEHDSKRAGAEVVKQSDNAPLSALIYPCMQALDEEHLGVDAQFGGTDQRKIFALAKEALPKLGYKPRAHLMNKMIPGLQGSKMSASDPDSKIDILDPPEVVRKKIKKAFAAPKIVEDNGILAFLEYVLLPAAALKGRSEFRVSRERDGLEPLVYTSIAQIHEDYRNDVLNPQIIKPAVTEALVELMESIQADFQASQEWQEIALKAYPPPEVTKKVKKVKDKGTRRPGGGTPAIEPTEESSNPT